MTRAPFIRSAAFDLTFFVGPAALSLLLVTVALAGAWPITDTPPWAFLFLVVGVDVAHVWSTLYRVYLDPVERRRRAWLYYGTPVAALFAGLLLVAVDPGLFWTVLAYVAVHHFVRQQVGFVALYRHLDEVGGSPNTMALAKTGDGGVTPARRTRSTRFAGRSLPSPVFAGAPWYRYLRRPHPGGERSPWTRRLDHLAVYAGTLVPVLDWHSRPRSFAWFVPGDFAFTVPEWVLSVVWPLYGAIGALWLGHRFWQASRHRHWNPGKDLTMLCTWAVWWVGIVGLDGDFSFTATNVLLHGVPYMALTWHTCERLPSDAQSERRFVAFVGRNALVFVGLLFVIAYGEELLWDGLVWKEHGALFLGADRWFSSAETVVVVATAVLATPQITHYVLDGFIWRMNGDNPGLRDRIFAPKPP